MTLRITAIILSASISAAQADQVYAPPSFDEVKAESLNWVAARGGDEELRAAVEEVWSIDPALATVDRRFDAVMQTFYLGDPAVRELVDACVSGDMARLAQGFDIVHSAGESPFFTNNVRYFYARYLTVLTMYDEALDLYAEIEPAAVVDPAACLFYRAVCEHSLLQKEAGLATIETLLTSTEDVPVRYATVAELMKHDLQSLREKSLGEVARQMRDVERRLALGRAGSDVQRVEERIITTLDEIIEKLEQQQGGGGGSGSGQPQGNQSSNPADDSYVGGTKAPGEVDRRDLGRKSGWGDLPDKAQAAAKNMINRQFPFHYRQAVEEYLKRIAQRPAPNE